MRPPVLVQPSRPLYWPGWLAAFGLLFGLAYAANVAQSGMGRFLVQLVGFSSPEPTTLALRALMSAMLAAAALGVGFAVRIFSFRGRVILVWSALLIAFVVFCYSFNLKLEIVVEKFPYLAGLRLTKAGFFQGAALTLFVCLLSVTFSTVLGLIAALGRLSNSAAAYGVSTFYTSFFRGTPLLVQVFLIYLGLPQIGIVMTAIPSGIIALSLNYGAYLAEIFRAGIQSIDKGQWEAATAIGLRPRLTLRKIILPQAMRVIVPPTGSQFIAMLKDSSLISMMGVWEIMFLARSYGRSEYRYIEMLLTAAVIYWVMSIGFELVQARLERHFGRGFQH